MRFWIPLLAVLAAAAALLLAPLPVVRSGSGVRLLGDTDPHYHVLRAERMARGAPGAPWRDPALGWPGGSEILWPPLFDTAIVGMAAAARAETRDEFALAASFVPPVLGVVSVLLAALAGRLIGGAGVGLLTGAVAAAWPALTRYAVMGRVDQHVAEVLLATAIAAAFVKASSEPRARAWPVVLGVAIAASFWTWMGSAVALLAPCASLAIARAWGKDELAGRSARSLAIAGATSTVLLAGTTGLFGAPGALSRTTLLGVGGFHVAILAGVTAFATVLAWRTRAPAPIAVRIAEVVLAVVLPAAVLFALWPGLWRGALHGATALAAANPWYAEINEYRPPLFGGVNPWTQDLATLAASLGAIPLLAALAIPAGRRRWVAAPASRPGLFLLAVWAATTLALSAARVRFLVYFAVPCAVSAALGALWLGHALAGKLRRERLGPAIAAAMIAAALLPTVGTAAALAAGDDRIPDEWIEAVRALRTVPPAPDGRATVGAPWDMGHLVQYYADRPVVTSPFGTDVGEGGMLDWTRFLFTTDDAEAEGVLLSRGVGLLLLRNPSHELVGLRGFARSDVPAPLAVTRDAWAGESVWPTPRYEALVVSRLYFGDGAGTRAGSIGGMRLVWEAESTRPDHPLHEERFKLFELVAGAELRVSGAAPGALVTATVPVLTNTGRTFTWSTHGTADREGSVALRIPYATGPNAAVRAGVCVVSDGARSTSAAMPAGAVAKAGAVAVSLAPPTARR